MTTAFLANSSGEKALWTLNTRTTVLATADSTGGALSAWEQRLTAAGNTPLHVHGKEDEYFYVLEGGVVFEVGEERHLVGPGGFVFAPRGVPHRFSVESEEARILVMVTPAGFEGFFSQVGRAAEGDGLPQPQEPDPAILAKAAASFGVEILGPPVQ